MSDFIPGLLLSRLFYDEAVRPILDRHAPGLRHSAALIGPGSEVLGFDTPRSTDHHWGPRLQLFLADDDLSQHRQRLDDLLRAELPPSVRGFSTHFGAPDDEGVRLPERRESGPIDHLVEITAVGEFFQNNLGLDPRGELGVVDWLTFSEQHLLSLTAGAVFHDGLGELEPVRARLASYPHDVWLFLLAAQWARIAEVEAFVGRTGEVADELGSRLVTARLVRDLMRLGFLQERRYAPYDKWFGTAFARLACAPDLGPALEAALAAGTWREREAALAEAYRVVAERHNALAIAPPLPTAVSNYYGRPFRVIWGERFAAAIRGAIADEAVTRLPFAVGSVNQVVDSTDKLESHALRNRLRALYG